MFYLASGNSVGLVSKSKVSSTNGGVTGGSKSDVCQVGQGDFTMLAVNGGMEQIDFGEGKKVSTQLHAVGLVKREPLDQVSFERALPDCLAFLSSLSAHHGPPGAELRSTDLLAFSQALCPPRTHVFALALLAGCALLPRVTQLSPGFSEPQTRSSFSKDPSLTTSLPSTRRNATPRCFPDLLCSAPLLPINTLHLNHSCVSVSTVRPGVP